MMLYYAIITMLQHIIITEYFLGGFKLKLKLEKNKYIFLGALILVITILCFSCSTSKKTNVKKISDSSEVAEEHFIIVPDLTGKTLEEAKALLSKRGLEVEKSGEEYSAFIPKDKINSQSPLTNDTAIKGTKITVKISKGPQVKKK